MTDGLDILADTCISRGMTFYDPAACQLAPLQCSTSNSVDLRRAICHVEDAGIVSRSTHCAGSITILEPYPFKAWHMQTADRLTDPNQLQPICNMSWSETQASNQSQSFNESQSF